MEALMYLFQNEKEVYVVCLLWGCINYVETLVVLSALKFNGLGWMFGLMTILGVNELYEIIKLEKGQNPEFLNWIFFYISLL